MRKIRVLIIEDSKVVRALLEEIIRRDSRFEIAGSVGSAEEALSLLRKAAPDVISLDIRLPGMNGFQATQRIMSERPTPIVVVSASVEKEDLKISMNALKAGALAIVEKPVGMTNSEYETMADQLCTQLAIMSEVKVIRQRKSFVQPPVVRPLHQPNAAAPNIRMMGLAASTGGPNALEKILSVLPSDFPIPILVVQHIAAGFLDGFAGWLNGACALDVRIAQDGELPQPGQVYLAPRDRHLVLRSGRLWHERSPSVSGQRPSATVLFQSMARELGAKAIGVLLTGMGDDGAQGLLEMCRSGAYTIAEDETTAVVYGMPGSAARLGAVAESIPLPDIAARIMELLT